MINEQCSNTNLKIVAEPLPHSLSIVNCALFIDP